MNKGESWIWNEKKIIGHTHQNKMLYEWSQNPANESLTEIAFYLREKQPDQMKKENPF